MADFGSALLDLTDCFCFVCGSGVLKVTFFFVEDGVYCCKCCSFICYFKLDDA